MYEHKCLDIHAKFYFDFFLTLQNVFSYNEFICSYEPKWISRHRSFVKHNMIHTMLDITTSVNMLCCAWST
jgi:hypothetical protein